MDGIELTLVEGPRRILIVVDHIQAFNAATFKLENITYCRTAIWVAGASFLVSEDYDTVKKKINDIQGLSYD